MRSCAVSVCSKQKTFEGTLKRVCIADVYTKKKMFSLITLVLKFCISIFLLACDKK